MKNGKENIMTDTPDTYGGLTAEEWRGQTPVATMSHQEFSQAGRLGMAEALDEIDRLKAEVAAKVKADK